MKMFIFNVTMSCNAYKCRLSRFVETNLNQIQIRQLNNMQKNLF